jgi:hypothetical protein
MMNIRKALLGGGLTAAVLLGGAAGATLVGGTAGAATTSTTAPATAAPSTSDSSTQASFPAHGTPEHESLEKAVTGDNATKAQDAAVKSVGSGTAGDVVTDAKGDGYEVIVTKADGSQVEVHLDSSFAVMQGHGGNGGGRPNDNDADDAATSSTPAA